MLRTVEPERPSPWSSSTSACRSRRCTSASRRRPRVGRTERFECPPVLAHNSGLVRLAAAGQHRRWGCLRPGEPCACDLVEGEPGRGYPLALAKLGGCVRTPLLRRRERREAPPHLPPAGRCSVTLDHLRAGIEDPRLVRLRAVAGAALMGAAVAAVANDDPFVLARGLACLARA